MICFDSETTGLNRVSDHPIGLSFAFEPEEAFYVPLHETHRLLPLATLEPVISSILQKPDTLKIGHNIKFDLQMLSNSHRKMNGPFADTMLMSYLLESSERSHSLDQCCLRYLGLHKIPTSELLNNKGSMLTAPLERLA